MTTLSTANTLTKYSNNFIFLLKDNTNKHSQIDKALKVPVSHTVGLVMLTEDNQVVLKKNEQGKLELPLVKVTSQNIEIDALKLSTKFIDEKIKQKYMFRIALNEGSSSVTSHVFMAQVQKVKQTSSILTLPLSELNTEIENGNLIDPTTIIAIDGILKTIK